ncbi:hypothetical protein AAVH_32188 [Aphelenchoides avenae]|nr:hypothetical protein AAVH_32188 [Aphelenchus avenae]
MLERIARIIVDSGAVKLPSVPVAPSVQKPEDVRRLLQCSFAESMIKAKAVPKTRWANANFSKVRIERGRRKSSSTDPEIKTLLQRFIDESDQEREDDSSDDEPLSKRRQTSGPALFLVETLCHDDTDLLRALDQESDYVEGIFNYNWWVKL